MSFHRYLYMLMATLGAGSLLLISTAIYLEPVIGDLTRLGGFEENGYGWRAEQLRFTERLFDRDQYDEYYDVVVFGDSFSYETDPIQKTAGSYWQDFFINKTGLSVLTFDANKVKIKDITESPIFKETPPRILVYQYVERDIMYVVNKHGLDIPVNAQCTASASPVSPPIIKSPRNLQATSFFRESILLKEKELVDDLNLSYSASFLKKNILRTIFGSDTGNVVNLKLTRGDLFSSDKSDKLLVFRKDFLKAKWSRSMVEDLACQLIFLQNFVQANGFTYFILLVAPDKLTAYKPYLLSGVNANSHISSLAKIGLQMPRIDIALKAALAAGVVDVYLPNDTHWGFEGHRVTAITLLEYLEKNGVLKR